MRVFKSALAVAISGFAALAAYGAAQEALPSVTQAPPAIAFAPWKVEGETSLSSEFSESFQSAITSAFAVNDVVPLRIFIPKAGPGPFPVVLLLHYWGARDLRVERALAGQLAARGVASVVMALPYHLGRTPAGHSSGALAIQPDPADLVRTMTQSVMDARRTIDFICSRPEFDSTRIGVSGTSLGSIVSALTFAVEPRIRYASFVLGGVDLAKIIWTSSRVVAQRDEMRRHGFTESRLRQELVSVEPKGFLQSRKDGTSLVIGGRYDTVVPAATTRELIESLQNPKVIWLETGHYGGILVQRKLLQQVAVFFSDEFASRTYVAPARVLTPTIRLGVIGSVGTTEAFDVGIGLDFFRSHEKLATFGTLLLTPRGPEIYIGRQIDRGFSFGAVGSPRRLGVGLMWSTVL